MASKYFWSFNCFQFVNAFQIKQILEKKKKNDLLLKTFNKKRSNSLMINPTKVDFEKEFSDVCSQISKFENLQMVTFFFLNVHMLKIVRKTT